LAEDVEQCLSTEKEAEGIIKVVVYSSWWLSPLGITTIAVGSFTFLSLAYIFLVPYGLRAYITWFLKQCFLRPYRAWLSLPTMRGRTVILTFVITFVALLGVGIYRRITSGFARFRGEEEPEAGTFVPESSLYELRNTEKMTDVQLKQLISSCSCTGDALRRAPLGLSAAAAAAAAAMVAVLQLLL